ncbi:universal stress protein family domain-containing protein [Nannizzia gypsea CBS 118893]|uniref:Universal stress protein family domain-containing protein n=1 Tax=Arthroderma gypseum (strain ATCC MYA-4604 / CBS 118893) TaxID=535722 RepID=E4UQW8_ARTGP|nr:universal stress protein family domain-containing protein [Nannizzia gypsea CBS 118893]EFQ99294.1 universal stress protein family domain-containing protein [Nannizzia gypsea CBS 118893]
MIPKMSLESALDEERREILELLQGRPQQQNSPQSPQSQQNQSPRPHHHATQAPPIRSMLDVAPDPSRRAGSVKSSSASVRSMLDPISPSPLRETHSAASSPTSSAHTPSIHESDGLRRASESSPYGGLPSIGRKTGVEAYQFGMLPSIPSQLPKRVTQGGKKSVTGNGNNHNNNGNNKHPSSMAAVMSGSDFGPLPGFPRGRQTGRHAPGFPHSSTSPMRSRSPGPRTLNSLNPLAANSKSNVNTFVTDSGRVINLDHAYRKLSNTALQRSGGSLAHLPHIEKKELEDLAENSDSDARLAKDYYLDTPDGGFSEDHTSDDEEDLSSDEELWRLGVGRGRGRTRKKREGQGADRNLDDPEAANKVRSLLAAAEEERKTVSSTYKVRSLLEPDNRAAAAATEKPMKHKTSVHPNTNFDITVSQGNTPIGSDDEGGGGGGGDGIPLDDEAEICEIKKAQNLNVYLSPTDSSVPNRVIRTIVRGDFAKMQEEAEQGTRRARSYLVATDLSEESVYALEWTIGTILRDGDTMYAIYAIDEEGSSSSAKLSETDLPSVMPITDGFKAVLDMMTTMHSQTEGSTKVPTRPPSSFPSPQVSSTHLPSSASDKEKEKEKGLESATGSVDARGLPKTEADRAHAIDGLTQTCVRLMRKTKLQVRVAVEVIHCKSPKHLITEAIDALEPTLVILGSRGRSALKGVLLGSFSNYLVTKSSAPVMVARKKLKKHAKFKNNPLRFSNNLAGLGSMRLANAKVD